jgi:DNA-binding beta-propeller fold protein YncE
MKFFDSHTMKQLYKTLLLSIFVMAGLTSLAQNTDQHFSTDGLLTYKNEIVYDQAPDLFQSASAETKDGYVTMITPGTQPEGDAMGEAAFSKDGQYLFMPNGMSNTLTVMDAVNFQEVTNIEMADFPYVAATDENHVWVSCRLANMIQVVDIATLEIIKEIPLPESDVVKMIFDDELAKLYCYAYYTDSPRMYVIDAAAMTVEATWENMPSMPYISSWLVGAGRSSQQFWGWEISNSTNELIIPDNAEEIIRFYDLETGTEVRSINFVAKPLEVVLNDDESRLVAISHPGTTSIYAINMETLEEITHYDLTFGYAAFSFVINPDGSKAFVGGNNQGHIINLDEGYVTDLNTNTAFGAITTDDGKYIYSSNNKGTVIDFEDETVKAILEGIPQGRVIAYPDGSNRVALYPGLVPEMVSFMDFTDPTSLNLEGQVWSGHFTEGDCPTRTAISPDGTIAVATNWQSSSVTIIDLINDHADTTIYVYESVRFCKITNDSRYAIIDGNGPLNGIKIIDLETMEIVALPETGESPGPMVLSPDGQYVYVLNIRSNTASKVLLDGENSVEVDEVYTGVVGLAWGAYGRYSDMAITHDGQYLLVAASFESEVVVIDTETMDIVKHLTAGNFPMKIAITPDDQYATVINYGSADFNIIQLDGENSTISDPFAPGLYYPICVTYNEVFDYMSIVSMGQIGTTFYTRNVDPVTGDLLSSFNYPQYGKSYEIDFDRDGLPVLLTGWDGANQGNVVYGGTGFPIVNSAPISFDYNKLVNKAVVACGGGGAKEEIAVISLGDPEATYSADEISVAIGMGGNLTENIEIENIGNGLLNCSFSNEEEWLTLGQQSIYVHLDSAGLLNLTIDATGLEMGLYEDVITITTNDPQQPTVEIPVSLDVLTKIEEQHMTSQIEIKPNPATKLVTISTSEPVSGIEIMDLNGRMFWQANNRDKIFNIDLEYFPEGIYLVLIKENNRKIKAKKFIVKNDW